MSALLSLIPSVPTLWLLMGGAIFALAVMLVIYRAGRRAERVDHLEQAYESLNRDFDTVDRAHRARRAAERSFDERLRHNGGTD